MRKSLLLLLLLAPLAMEVCLAQANAMYILCDACRDPHEFPEDYANFAFNQIYGPDAWLTFEQADDFFITNLHNQTVYVDADFVFTGLNLQGIQIPLWPLNLIQITLALPNGNLHTVFRSVFQTSLPVPASTGDGQYHDSSGGGGGGDDSDDEEDYGADAEEFEWEEVEIDGYEGDVWIEDPDEDGNFDDVDWCEEC